MENQEIDDRRMNLTNLVRFYEPTITFQSFEWSEEFQLGFGVVTTLKVNTPNIYCKFSITAINRSNQYQINAECYGIVGKTKVPRRSKMFDIEKNTSGDVARYFSDFIKDNQ